MLAQYDPGSRVVLSMESARKLTSGTQEFAAFVDRIGAPAPSGTRDDLRSRRRPSGDRRRSEREHWDRLASIDHGSGSRCDTGFAGGRHVT